MYFTQIGAQARQMPSQMVNFSKKLHTGQFRTLRTVGAQTNFTQRMVRRPQRFEPIDMEPWQKVAMASLNFKLPPHMDKNVIQIQSKDSQDGEGSGTDQLL